MQRPLPVVTGASGRIGRMLRALWGEGGADWRSRRDGPPLAALPVGGTLLCLAGVVPGAGDLHDNARIAEATVRAAEAAGMRRVLLLSSAAVYPAGEGLREEDAAPASDYGRAKLAMEAVRSVAVEVTALRLGNVAGADALLGRLGDAAPRLHVWPDGRAPRRSYVGPSSLARILRALADHPAALPPVLNVAAPGAVGMDALLDAAGRAWEPVPAPPDAVPVVALDVARLAALVPLDPAEGTAPEIVRQWREAVA
ncbi:NAD(P)-dependent oxidoreductase [Jannaschia sp. W003]|uniref:NAD-dependent epimerase/dehydratase family protein n=1 Tax=Jannaschia sp. W003 TaxID=2867012 RepID=UPI0021A72CE1|nr:NAD-dependent epimerase/dehydratase family protein [Jannaschia sp. W003]UWQ22153.1 NAD-dependent epimerase/dehydratase family protein [Jannaschia sp. W003]